MVHAKMPPTPTPNNELVFSVYQNMVMDRNLCDKWIEIGMIHSRLRGRYSFQDIREEKEYNEGDVMCAIATVTKRKGIDNLQIPNGFRI